MLHICLYDARRPDAQIPGSSAPLPTEEPMPLRNGGALEGATRPERVSARLLAEGAPLGCVCLWCCSRVVPVRKAIIGATQREPTPSNYI